MKHETFREKMLAEMAARKWGVARLAREAGVSYDVVRELKRRPHSSTSIDNARKIGAVLGFSVDSLEDADSAEDERDLIENYRALSDPAHREKVRQEAAFLLRQEAAKKERDAGDLQG